MSPQRYDSLLLKHTQQELDAWKLVRVNERFRIMALGLPVCALACIYNMHKPVYTSINYVYMRIVSAMLATTTRGGWYVYMYACDMMYLRCIPHGCTRAQVPRYPGNPLDPPLRSRFQARDIRVPAYTQLLDDSSLTHPVARESLVVNICMLIYIGCFYPISSFCRYASH